MTFQPNPVAMRESRAMWRGARSFLLLGCYAGTLALVAFLAYFSEVRSATDYAGYSARGSGAVEVQVMSARVGRSLFVALSYVQLVAWLLIAPALTSTSISSERERGLLESLLMSYLKPRQIIAGKLGVCASFILILIVATLPILALCFLLGGVSPGEFGVALAIQVSTAFCALSLGVWCSSSLRLSTHALGATFGGLTVWIVLTLFAFGMPDTGPSMGWTDHTSRFLALTNPLLGLYSALDPDRYIFRGFFLPPAVCWPLCVAFQVLAGSTFLLLATRRLSRPMDEEEVAPVQRKGASSTSEDRAGTWDAAASTSITSEEAEAQAVVPSERDGHFEVPLLRRIVMGGPLLRHNLRAAWRWKAPRGRARRWWIGCSLFFLTCCLYAMSWVLRSPRDADSVLVMTVMGLGLGIPVFVTASSALSIARDRELGTWNHLRLSAIGSAELTRAKLFAPIVSALGYSLLLAPLCFLAVTIDRLYDDSSYTLSRNLSPIVLLTAPWLLMLVQLSGWGLICSIRARRSSIALTAAVAGGLLFLVGAPVIVSLSLGSYSDYQFRRELQEWLALVHPGYALALAGDLGSRLHYSPERAQTGLYIASLCTHALFATGFVLWATRAVAQRER